MLTTTAAPQTRQAWSPGVQHGTCELQDQRPIAGEIAGVKLCQTCIDTALELAEKERARIARISR